MDTAFLDRMFTLKSAIESQAERDGSAQGRLELIEAQAKMAARFPHGAGFRGTEALSAEYLDARWVSFGGAGGRSSHNTFMTALVDHGIPGANLYIWLTAWGLAAVARLRALQSRRVSMEELTALAVACCAGIAVVWTAGQFTDYLLAEVQFWLFALLVANLELIRLAISPTKAAAVDLPDPQRPLDTRRAP